MMAVGSKETAVAGLRAITYRLSSTPTQHLPNVVPQIAGQLWNCKDLLSSTPDLNKQNNDATVVVHRFKTHLSTLLQDRTVEGRWSAVVLVKATIEAGGIEVLSKSNAWVRSLLGILKKPDPPSTKRLAIIALTRIFMLTWDHSNLVREITTPALPAFISCCLNNVASNKCSSTELQTVLEAFATLTPRHPTIFRTNESQLRFLLARIISSTSNDLTAEFHYTKDHRKAAQRLLVLLHHCSPKQGAADKWDEAVKATVTAAHATCDQLFRSVIEDWESTAGVQPSAHASVIVQGDPGIGVDETLGLHGWKGVYAGTDRVIALLGLLCAHMASITSAPVAVRLGLVTDLLARLFSIRIPHGKHATVQSNAQISKDEREALFSVLPQMHVAAMQLIDCLLARFQHGITALLHPLLSHITWIFESEVVHFRVRNATYTTLASLLETQGPAMAKADAVDVESVIRACCRDLLPAEGDSIPQTNGVTSAQASTTTGISGHGTNPRCSHPTSLEDLQKSAKALLPICFTRINPVHMPGRLRILMERTAVLTQNKEALVACVLNPSSSNKTKHAQPSLLPLLARQYPDCAEVEAMLRPRMPMIGSGVSRNRQTDGLSDEELEEDNDDEERDEVNAQMDREMEREEPTDGLLAALDGKDDLHTGSSPQHLPRPNDETAQPQASEKRPAIDNSAPVESDGRAAKRPRPSPITEPTVPAFAPELAAPVPVTVVPEPPASSFVTAPEASQQTATIPAEAADAEKEDGDGSDFEMPPLTMESDSEAEDDEDEADE